MATHDLTHIPVALSVRRRITGLLGKRERPDLFLLIPACRVIHTLFMRSSIDLVFLDKDGQVLSLVAEGRPWRIFRGPTATDSVLELPPGQAREMGLHVGDTATFNMKDRQC